MAAKQTAKKSSTDKSLATTEQKTDVSLEKEIDHALVEKAYEKITNIVHKYLSDTMNDVGEYLIKNFYADDYKRVQDKKPAKEQSLNQLIKKIHQSEDDTPSKTWIYNAVNLIADERHYKEIGFSVYGKLGRSHKVYLTHVNDKDEKKKLIEDTVKNNYTVAQLREKIAQIKRKKAKYEFELLADKTALINLTLKTLKGWKDKTEGNIKNLTETLQQYEKAQVNLLAVIQEKELEQAKKDKEKQDKEKAKAEKEKAEKKN